MKKIGFYLLFTILILGQTHPVFAAKNQMISSEIDRTFPAFSIQFGKTKIEVGNDLTVYDDTENKTFLLIGNKMSVTDLDTKHLLSAASSVELLNESKSSKLFLVGDQIVMNGEHDKAFVAGNQVVIKAKSDQVNVAGAYIEYLGTAKTVRLAGETVVINGTISGNLEIVAKNVIINEDAKVTGKISIWSEGTATLMGEINENQITYYDTLSNSWDFFGLNQMFMGARLASYMVLFVLTFVFVKFGTQMVGRFEQNVKERKWVPFAIGLAILLGTPVLIALAAVTVIGIPISIILTIIYALILALTPVVCGIVLGNKLGGKHNPYVVACMGVVIFNLLLYIPYIGWILGLAASLFTLGSFAYDLMNKKKKSLNVNS